MLVRTRRMRNSGKDVRLPKGISSLEEDIEMSLPAKSMIDELQSYMDARIQEKWRHSMRMSELNHQWFKNKIWHS